MTKQTGILPYGNTRPRDELTQLVIGVRGRMVIKMKILLKNGQLVDYATNVDAIKDIYIENGIITEISDFIEKDADEVIDCKNLTIIPGVFDMHIHLRDPGQTHKEDIYTGCEAAVAGGVTGVLCMPNTSPVLDTPELIKYVVDKAKTAKAKVYPVAAITRGFAGQELSDFEALKAAGAVAVSDDGRPVKNSALMARAMIEAGKQDLTVISHCEDLDIIDGGIINYGEISKKLEVKGMHRASENIITSREIGLARDYNTKIHIAHVSTKEAVNEIGNAKKMGINVTCETAPHYFILTDKELLKKDADYRMNPPLREDDDAKAIIDNINNGVIDAIVTDHAPHTADEKADFLTAPNGVIGLETSLAATLTQLYHIENVSLLEIVKLMCVNPRKILGISGGSIKVGETADIAIFNKNEEWVVIPDKLHSKSKNTCFKNIKLKGKVKYTLVDGIIKYKDS